MRKTHYLLVYLIALLLITSGYVYATTVQPGSDADNYIGVEFDNAPLSEIVILVSEVTGNSFVISSDQAINLTWVEQNIHKEELISRFNQVIGGAGLILHSIAGMPPLYVIKSKASVVASSSYSFGYYRLRNLDSRSLKDTSEVLYGGALTVHPLENSPVVVFTGSPELVGQFMNLLSKIDIPQENDFEIIRVKNISVKTAIKALADTKLIKDNTFFPDYWNRSIIVKGSPYERQVARAVIGSIDKPQTGWIDQLEYIRTVDSEAVISVLGSTCENVEVRKVAADRVLISGFEQDVDKASALLHKIDGTGLQVKVEAIIAYLTDREFKELGIRLSGSGANFIGSLNQSVINKIITPNTGLLLDYFNDQLGISIAAKEGKSHGEILSSPVLTVLNGQQARIHVGQNVPYLSTANFNKNDGTETGTSIERQDIGITFNVRPSIEPGGEFVHLEVSQEVSNVIDDSELSQDAIDIIVDKKEIQSTVMIADGDTIFLGGLRSEENGTAKDYVPLLGELPILGKLFTYDVEQKENRHLIVSLRVKVIGKG